MATKKKTKKYADGGMTLGPVLKPISSSGTSDATTTTTAAPAAVTATNTTAAPATTATTTAAPATTTATTKTPRQLHDEREAAEHAAGSKQNMQDHDAREAAERAQKQGRNQSRWNNRPANWATMSLADRKAYHQQQEAKWHNRPSTIAGSTSASTSGMKKGGVVRKATPVKKVSTVKLCRGGGIEVRGKTKGRMV